ncbi:hypothetical protein C7447_101421 [Tenacibaculum adriaticum]|uniref:LA2681-like HEPN domain-containing protein n=1 Tax=Tenacibaculum adriaticum TaxID=413713 RepID=A0A5S5DXN4_9FLAO|nr:LA2681 family HEPN domain-containing protein [Tenacibaculum adriaticum]TYP99816.1 hypothetical protein C7447_101421 [Tenacibaculum adriaticum]
MNPIPLTSIAIHEEINLLIDNKKYDDALDKLDKVINGEIPIEPEFFKVQLVESYIVIADTLIYYRNRFEQAKKVISKGIGLLKSLKKIIPEEEVGLKQFHNSVTARAHEVKYTIELAENTFKKGETLIDYSKIKNIYSIKDSIQKSISLYRVSLKDNTSEIEEFNIKNNLAVSLGHVGRYLEAMTYYEENIKKNNNHIKSSISWADSLLNIVSKYQIKETPSLYYKAAERLEKIYLEPTHDAVIRNTESSINFCKKRLEENGFELNKEQIIKNINEEIEYYKNHSELRKFSLDNNVTLSEHAIYCKCTDAYQDDLLLNSKNNDLNQLLEIIKSEFSFSRFLLFEHKTQSHPQPNDVLYDSSIKIKTGYSIEYLKMSFKLAYSILDKLGNGIVTFYNLNQDNFTYFENVFDVYKAQLINEKNISLCALYSLSLDLNKDSGKLRLYKKLRNLMEHEFTYKIIETKVFFNESNKTISLSELESFTMELLKIVRSAIFSFTFLIRSEENK